MKTLNLLLASSMILLLSSCGGGGGDGDDARVVSGIWRGALTKISDNCSVSGPAAINVSHQVNQNEDAVTLLAESGVSFLGNTVGENGFSVDGSHSTIGQANCSDQTRIEYDSINEDDDQTADVLITISRTCPGSVACTLQYSGTASRSANPTGTAVPTPNVTPGTTPIAGGCKAINTKPANDTFSGDGGCGISDAAFSIQGEAVVLEPFGANGLTTFNIDTANTSLANSQRTDLTILNDSGYSCSVLCSAPSTFTVRCIKEGATSCTEKF